jgi:hypothetical protein
LSHFLYGLEGLKTPDYPVVRAEGKGRENRSDKMVEESGVRKAKARKEARR